MQRFVVVCLFVILSSTEAYAQRVPMNPVCGIFGSMPNKKYQELAPFIDVYFKVLEGKISSESLTETEVSRINTAVEKYSICTCGTPSNLQVEGDDENGNEVDGVIKACSDKKFIFGNLDLPDGRNVDIEGDWVGGKAIRGVDDLGKEYYLKTK